MLHPFPSRFLRQVLLVDAALSGATGLLQVFFTGWLAIFLNLPAPLLQWTGVVLILYAAAVALLGAYQQLSRPMVWAVITINMAWALAATGLLVFRWFDPNSFGIAWVLLQVVVVTVFAELQYVAIRRSKDLAPEFCDCPENNPR